MTRQIAISSKITKAQALNVKNAFDYAESVGMPMDRHITILWSLLNNYPRKGTIEDQCLFVRERLDILLHKMDDFCRYHRIPKHFVYVQENAPHAVKNLEKMVHTHMAVHMPDDLISRFEHLLNEWVFNGQRYRRRKNTVQIKSHSAGKTIMAYILKGVDPAATVTVPDQGEVSLQEYLKITADPSKWNQGLFHGKRVGMSKALSKARSSDAPSLRPPAPSPNSPVIDLQPVPVMADA